MNNLFSNASKGAAGPGRTLLSKCIRSPRGQKRCPWSIRLLFFSVPNDFLLCDALETANIYRFIYFFEASATSSLVVSCIIELHIIIGKCWVVAILVKIIKKWSEFRRRLAWLGVQRARTHAQAPPIKDETIHQINPTNAHAHVLRIRVETKNV